MKYLNTYSNYQNNSDGTKYFDMNSLNDIGGFQHPLYYMLAKDQKYQLVFISPDEYMENIRKGFNLNKDEVMNAVNLNTVSKYAQNMLDGDKFPIGYFTTNTSSQEGRHRALALKKIGVESFPVIAITVLSKIERDHLALKLKGMTFEEVDQYMKKEGYSGISKLDYRELTVHLEHRM
jgi:hypothetical protein